MKEKLLEDALTKMTTYLQNTEVFMAQNAPEYIRQLLDYSAFANICLLSSVLIAIAIVLSLFFIALAKDNDEAAALMAGVTLLALLSAIVLVPLSINNMYKIKHAPKVFLLDKIEEKIKTLKCGD